MSSSIRQRIDTMNQVSELAGSYPPQAAGLPRGRGRIPREDVASEQRARIIRAAVAAIADIGYHESTIADIVRRARVSREAFYRNFAGKLECFEAAIEMGQSVVLPRIAAAADSVRDADLDTILRVVVAEYLRVSASEPEFSIAWAIELAATGKRASALRDRYFDLLAEFIREAHVRSAPTAESEPRPLDYYVALIGGCNELICRQIRSSGTNGLPDLEDPIVGFLVQGLRDAPARPPRVH